MARYRSVDQTVIHDSLKALFTFIEEKNVGPRINAALASWQAPGELLDQILAAKTNEELEKALVYSSKIDAHNSLSFFMCRLFGNFLPNYEGYMYAIYQQDKSIEPELLAYRQLVKDAFYWGGFSLHRGVMFDVATGCDGDAGTFLQRLEAPNFTPSFCSYNTKDWPTPFVTLTGVFTEAVDVQSAVAHLKVFADKIGMLDHVDAVSAVDGALAVRATDAFADAYVARARSEMPPRAVLPFGIVKKGILRPLRQTP